MFGDSLWRIALAFLNDVVVPSRSVQEWIDRLSDVLDKLYTIRWSQVAAAKKCNEILGFIVRGNSMEMIRKNFRC